MDPNNQDLPESVDAERRPWRAIAFIFIGLLIASGIVIAVYQLTKSDDGGDTDQAAVAIDDGVDLPQNPSLRLFEDADTIYVENDGNVTMSGIQVLDGASVAVCDLGTISPGDRQPCDAASDALSPVTATGSGPQGQAVETGLE